MSIEVTVGQIVTFGGILAGGIGAYWKLKGKLDSQGRECEINLSSIIDDLKENDEEVQKVWSKMLTKDGHTQECTIMSLRVEKAIKESGDAVQGKVEETIIDFQKEMRDQLAAVLAAVNKGNGSIAPEV